MKVAIISDTHFGYKWGEERGEDPFRNAREAFERAKDADLIVLPGDIFDRKIPKQEVLDRASEILSIPMESERTVETDSELDIHGSGTPVVAIHGTHERRPENYTNPIELMANTGHLHHLHNQSIQLERDGEKVAVHGMSGVPEEYAPKVLEKFNPEPIEDAFNILVLHQSIEGFVYTAGEKDYLTPEMLPEGFDLIVDGHIHWYDTERFPDSDKPIVFPGSTVTTQMRKVEAERGKGFLMLDTREKELDFVELDSPREVHYVELEVSGEPWSEVKERAINKLEGLEGEKPLVNLKIKGETSGRVNPRELKQRFRDDIFLNVNSSLETRNEERAEISEEMDPMEEGKEILHEKLDTDIGLERDRFFQLLESGKPDDAVELLKEAEKND